MLTQNMPAMQAALQGQLSDGAVRSLMQSLGNCSQDVMHRGGVSVMPSAGTSFGSPAVRNRMLGGGRSWTPSDYPTINLSRSFPQRYNNNPTFAWIDGRSSQNNGDNVFVDMTSTYNNYKSGDWYTTNYGSPQYHFSNPVTNELYNYYEGDNVFFAGDTYFNNIVTNNITIIDNPPGDGTRGRDGTDGTVGPAGVDGSVGPLGPAGENGRNGFGAAGARGPAGPPGGAGAGGANGRDGLPGAPGEAGGIVGGGGGDGGNAVVQQEVRNLRNELARLRRRLEGIRFVARNESMDVLVDATFSAEACDIDTETQPIRYLGQGSDIVIPP